MAKVNYLGIDNNWKGDSIRGFLVGLVLIVIFKVFGVAGAIGIPLNLAVSLDDVGKFIIIVLVAPIVEEGFFRQSVLSFFDEKLENFGLKVPFIVATILTAGVFSLFHLYAYGSSLSSAGGSFFSAFLIGIIFAYEVKVTKSVITSTVTHAILNFSVLVSLTAIFS